MRNFVAATVAATFIATSALAATSEGPLAPGKPVGVKPAQDFNGKDNTLLYVVGLGVIAAGIAVVASGDSDGSLVAGTLPVTPVTSSSNKASTSST